MMAVTILVLVEKPYYATWAFDPMVIHFPLLKSLIFLWEIYICVSLDYDFYHIL